MAGLSGRRRGSITFTRRGWLGAAAALGVAACTRRDANVLRFWAMGREGEVVGPLLEQFEREHPGLQVRLEQLPWSAAHEKLLTAFAGDATPDVAQLGNTWLPEFAALGALAPLDERIAAADGFDAADFFDGIWRANRIDGRRLGVPWYVDTRLQFYRRDMLARAGHAAPPTDWAAWRRMLVDVKRVAGPGNHAALLPVNEFEALVAFALQTGEPLLRDGGRFGNFRAEGFRRVWRFFLSLYEDGLAPTTTASEISNVWAEFARGFFSVYVSGPWQIGEFRRRLPAALQPHWATAPLPGPDGPGASIAGGSSLAVFARSSRPDAAFALLRFLAAPDAQRRLHALTGNLPPRRSVWADAALRDDPALLAFRDQLERARPVPQVPEWERIATEMRIVLERVLRGEVDAAGGLEELDARADRILAKRRWMLERRP